MIDKSLLYNNIMKNISYIVKRKLNESLLDDLEDNDDDDSQYIIETKTKVKPYYEKLKSLKNGFKYKQLIEVLEKYEYFNDIPKRLEIVRCVISIHDNNMEIYKNLFDMFLLYNIHVNINVLEFELDKNDILEESYCIKDYFNFEKYKTIFNIETFVISKGILQDLQGVPEGIDEIYFLFVKLGSFKGCPISKYLDFYFDNSSLPDDWYGLPKTIQCLYFDHDENFNAAVRYDQIETEVKESLGSFKNFPANLKFEKNTERLTGPSNDLGIRLFNNKRLSSDIKKCIKDYVTTQIKKQGLPLMKVKKLLFSSYTY